jgi:hypothetical protein
MIKVSFLSIHNHVRSMKFCGTLSNHSPIKLHKMKAENQKMATDIETILLPKFKGLGKKSASKMVKATEKVAVYLAKKFNKLLEKDMKDTLKLEKKATKKAEKKSKVAIIIVSSDNAKVQELKPTKTISEAKKALQKASKNVKNVSSITTSKGGMQAKKEAVAL